jgi:hypothetical protein
MADFYTIRDRTINLDRIVEMRCLFERYGVWCFEINMSGEGELKFNCKSEREAKQLREEVIEASSGPTQVVRGEGNTGIEV